MEILGDSSITHYNSILYTSRMQADETSYGTLLSALERVGPGWEEDLNRFVDDVSA